jgi:hypothetical protein
MMLRFWFRVDCFAEGVNALEHPCFWKNRMYDHFTGELRCPRCGTINSTIAYTNMQTHLRSDADGSALAVGYEFQLVDLTTKHILDAGYSLVSPPYEGGASRLLEVWNCPVCETEQWAMVEIVNRKVARIEAVLMNRTTFEAANFISEVNAELLSVTLMGILWAEFSERKLNSVDVLKQQLA